MADTYKGNFQLEARVNHYRMISALLWVPTVTYIVAFLQGYYFTNILHLIAFTPGIIGVYFWRKAAKLRKSIRAEKEVVDIKKHLPKGLEMFHAIEVTSPNGKERAEIDHLLVGKKGVFVINVQDVDGSVEGNESASYWMLHKEGRKGGNYSSQFRNPIKEVRKQVHLLTNQLKKEKLEVWVEGAVFFSDPKAVVNIKNSDKTPVFSDSDDLTSYLKNYSPKKEFSDEQLEEMKAMLKERVADDK